MLGSTLPHSDSDGDTLDGAIVNGVHDSGQSFSHFVDGVEMLLDFLGQYCGVDCPIKLPNFIYTQEFGAGHSFHQSTFDGQTGMLGWDFLKSTTIPFVTAP